MEWIREGEVLLPGTAGQPDSLRAWRPWVIEEPDGALRMWYSGDDGTTSRILAALQPPGGAWDRLGIAVEAPGDGETPTTRAETPSAGKKPRG